MSVDERTRLIEENLELAKGIAARYKIPGTAQEDIVGYANEALCKAANEWGGRKGDFKAYAARAIWNALHKKYEEAARGLDVVTPNPPDPDQPEEADDETSDTSRYWKIIEAVRQNEAKEALEEAMEILEPMEKVAVKKFMVGKSLSEIGNDMKFSKEWVRQILGSAFAKLKPRLEELNVRGVATDGGLASKGKNLFKR